MVKSRQEIIASDRQYRDLRPDEVVDYVVDQAAVLYIIVEKLVMTPEVYFAALELARRTSSVRVLTEQISTI